MMTSGRVPGGPPSPNPPTPQHALCDQSSGIERGANGSKGPGRAYPHCLPPMRERTGSRNGIGGKRVCTRLTSIRTLLASSGLEGFCVAVGSSVALAALLPG